MWLNLSGMETHAAAYKTWGLLKLIWFVFLHSFKQIYPGVVVIFRMGNLALLNETLEREQVFCQIHIDN